MAEDINNRIFTIIEEVADCRPEMDDKFKDIGLDSLDVVDLIMRVETEFNIAIPDDVADDIETVKQLIAVVEGYVGNRSRF